jgi:apolipoprotein N-acyltransferase
MKPIFLTRRGILFFLPIVSALLVTVAFPPFELGIVAWFGLAPLLFALRQRGSFEAAGLAFLFACLFGIGAFSWVHSIATINLVSFLVVLLAFSLYFVVFGLAYRLISRGIGSWIIIGAPALWVALEYARSNLFFLSFPWNLLGHSQYRYLPVIQIADITGVYGISFLIVMVNQFLSQLPDLVAIRKEVPTGSNGRNRNINWASQLLTLALALVLTFSYGSHSMALQDSDKHLRVALVQANVLTRDNMSLAEQAEHLRAYKRLTMEAADKEPELIAWPASSLPAPISSSRLVRLTIRRLASETGAYLLVGGAGYEKVRPEKEGHLPYSNSEFLISPSGHLEGQYNKIMLLPFNEYLPLKGKFPWPGWITTLRESFIPGKEHTLFQVSGVSFGAPICWENMFPDLFRRFVIDGAQFMVSVTNEAFFGSTSAPYQSLAINVFRAVENRVAIARVSTTGISAFINPNGELAGRVRGGNGEDLFVSGFLVRDVPISNKRTIYTVYGDIFAYVAIFGVALIMLVSFFAQRRTRSRMRNRYDF